MPITSSAQKPSTKHEPSLASTMQFLEERLTVASIMQPAQAVLGAERAGDVLNRMTERGYDYAPVADRGEVSHFVSRESLEKNPGGSVLECAQAVSAHAKTTGYEEVLAKFGGDRDINLQTTFRTVLTQAVDFLRFMKTSFLSGEGTD